MTEISQISSLNAPLRPSLADEPQWVELNALLSAPAAKIWHSGAGGNAFAVVATDGDLGAVRGSLESAMVRAAAEQLSPRGSLLAYAENVEAVRAALPGWNCSRAWQHVLTDESMLAALECGEAGWIDANSIRALVTDEGLRDELLDAASRESVVAAHVGGRPVAFAYAPWRTERWSDLSVDTLAGYRRQGHATRAFAWLWRQISAQGRSPVWGAEECNTASMAMASRLGFRRVAEVYVFTKPSQQGD